MLLSILHAPTDRIGGKALALRRLLEHGLPVPPAAVLTTDAFEVFLAHNRLDAGDAEGILRGEMPFALPPVAAWMAVRSSAIGEDGGNRSHAGVYDSVLGVGAEGLADAVRRVWASWASPRARAYRAAAPATGAGMAVLVQELVDARVSGVLFTVNPLSGSWREMVVEAVWGLGEGLVGGTVVPDRYLVGRPRRTPRPIQRVLARARLALESETIAPQRVETVIGRAGVTERKVDAPLARKLVSDDLLALCRLGLRAESLLAGPQDVEWALDRAGRPWILQARPITTRMKLPRGGKTLWTRRFVGERWPDGVTPMTWSIVAQVLDGFISYPETSRRFLGGDPPLRLVGGHPYLNATVFRHLAFKLPGAPPPRFMLEFFPSEEEEAWVGRVAAPPDLRVYASILHTTFVERRWERFRWNPFRNHHAWDEFLAGLDARLAVLDAAPPRAAVRIAEPILRDYVKVHITSLLFANLYYQIVEPLLPAEDRAVLLRPHDGTITLRVNRELRALTTNPEGLDGFLAAHGHRSSASWEIFSRRWSDDPEAVMRLSRLSGEVPEADAHATKRALARLPMFTRSAVMLAQAYLRLREEQRYHLDRVFAGLQRKLLVLAREWFDDPADVRLLRQAELTLPDDEIRAIAQRRARERIDPAPPDFLHGDEALAPPAAASRLQGLGISPGLVSGTVRVLQSPDEGHRLRQGDILVARATDPGWTPLFSRAGGMVLELGSLLSHGAVVAREYRVPGVVNVGGATKLLRDGMEVTLDGRSGVVWLHG